MRHTALLRVRTLALDPEALCGGAPTASCLCIHSWKNVFIVATPLPRAETKESLLNKGRSSSRAARAILEILRSMRLQLSLSFLWPHNGISRTKTTRAALYAPSLHTPEKTRRRRTHFRRRGRRAAIAVLGVPTATSDLVCKFAQLYMYLSLLSSSFSLFSPQNAAKFPQYPSTHALHTCAKQGRKRRGKTIGSSYMT